MSRLKWFLYGLLSCFCVVSFSPIELRAQEHQIIRSMEELREIYSKRKEKYRSLFAEVSTTTIDTSPPELRKEMTATPRPIKTADKMPTEIPDGPLTKHSTWRLYLSGETSRYEFDGSDESKSDAQIAAFDGKESRLLGLNVTTPKTKEKYQAGFITAQQSSVSDDIFDVLPLQWCIRGIRINVSKFDSSRLILSSEHGIFDNDECLLATYTRDDGPVYTMWFSPKKDYSIVRLTQMSHGKMRSQVDCYYEKTPTGLWAPSKWTGSRFLSGAVYLTGESKIEHIDLNQDIPKNKMSLPFPAGTVVRDSRPDAPKGRTGTYDYLVKEDGTKRRILWSELDASLAEIKKTETGDASPKKKSVGWVLSTRWVTIISINLLVICVAGAYYTRRRLLRARVLRDNVSQNLPTD